MKHFTILIFLLSTLFALSCTKEKPTLQKIGDLKFAIDDSTDDNPAFRYYFDENANRQFLYATSRWRKSIDIYELIGHSLLKSIRFLNSSNNLDAYIQNFDSIFVIDENISELFISDSNGNILHKWNLNSVLSEKDFIYSAYSFWAMPMYYYDNRVFLNIVGSGSPVTLPGFPFFLLSNYYVCL